MSNQEIIIRQFLSVHPEYEPDSKKLICNLWGDILIDVAPRKLIAESNLHGKSVAELGFSMPESWKLV